METYGIGPSEKRDNSDKGSGIWQCYGCLARMESLPEGFDTRCEHCGSYEIHLADRKG